MTEKRSNFGGPYGPHLFARGRRKQSDDRNKDESRVSADRDREEGNGISGTRRRLLQAVGTSSLAGFSGCSDLISSGDVVSSNDDAQKATVFIETSGSFVPPGSAETLAQNCGTGFIVDPSGITVTNSHVVNGGASYRVYVGGRSEGEEKNASIIGVAECADLAVLDIEGEGYPTFEWASERPALDDDVWAFGFPLCTPDFTLTRGGVSTIRANVATPWASVDAVIEHTARIRGGNSGGPLVNENGEVVGVNYAGSDQFDFNLAIPATAAREITDQIRSGTEIHSIGINGEAFISEDGSASGVWVTAVRSGGPAGNAGIEPGDLIVTLERAPVARDGTLDEYCNILRSRPVGSTFAVQVFRPSTGELFNGEINGRPLELVVRNEVPDAQQPTPPDQGTIDEPSSEYSFGIAHDNTGTIQVELPEQWSDRDGQPLDLGPNLIASPDIQQFNQGYGVPGSQFLVSTQLQPDHDGILDQLADIGQPCSDQGRQDYDDGHHRGRLQIYGNCEGGSSAVALISASPPDDQYVLIIIFKILAERDVTALERAIATLQIQPSAL